MQAMDKWGTLLINQLAINSVHIILHVISSLKLHMIHFTAIHAKPRVFIEQHNNINQNLQI